MAQSLLDCFFMVHLAVKGVPCLSTKHRTPPECPIINLLESEPCKVLLQRSLANGRLDYLYESPEAFDDVHLVTQIEEARDRLRLLPSWLSTLYFEFEKDGPARGEDRDNVQEKTRPVCAARPVVQAEEASSVEVALAPALQVAFRAKIGFRLTRRIDLVRHLTGAGRAKAFPVSPGFPFRQLRFSPSEAGHCIHLLPICTESATVCPPYPRGS